MTNAELATQIYPKCSHRRAMLLQVLKAIEALPDKEKIKLSAHIINSLKEVPHAVGNENYRAAVSVQRVEDMQNMPAAKLTTGFGICANVFEGVGVKVVRGTGHGN